jgi:hypothetical protein
VVAGICPYQNIISWDSIAAIFKGYINDPKKTRNRHSAKTLVTPCKLKAQGSPCPNFGTAVFQVFSFGALQLTVYDLTVTRRWRTSQLGMMPNISALSFAAYGG